MFGYGRPERRGTDIRDFRGEPQQPSGGQVPVAVFALQLVRGRRQAILFHGALQEVHLSVLQVRRPDQFVHVHRQIRYICRKQKRVRSVWVIASEIATEFRVKVFSTG